MSQFHLLDAVRTVLRDQLHLPDNQCDIETDGRPPPVWGGAGTYYAIYPTGHIPGPTEPNQGLDEYFSIAITLTRRTGLIPEDYLPEQLITQRASESTEHEASLEVKAREVMVVMYTYRNTIMTTANTNMSGSDGFIEPLRWAGNDPAPQRVGAEWFGASPGDTAALGYTYTLNYHEARRMQALANLE